MADPTDDIDPTVATNGDELAACMRWLRTRADNISYRELERWGELHDKPLPRTTLLEVLHGRRFPRKSVLLAFVEACGVDPATDTRWEKVWNRLNDELNLPDLSEPTVPLSQAAAENLGDERPPEPAVPVGVWKQAQDVLHQAELSAETIVSNANEEKRRILERAHAQAAAIRSAAEREAAQIREVAVERAAQEAEETRRRALQELAKEVDALEQQSAGPPEKGRQQPLEQGTEARPRRWFGR